MLILAGLAFFAILLAPIYFHNFQLQNFVAGITKDARNQSQPDNVLRTLVIDRARQLDLPVPPDSVQISHSSEGVHIEVRYFVRVSFPGYTVDLHFSGNR
jgi:hypothetical protein